MFAVVASVVACSPSDDSRGVIDRETFVGTYVDLRAAAMSEFDGALSPESRERILGTHAVTGRALEAFAEVHGADLEYMKELWNEIELRLDSIRPSEASGSEPR